MDNWSISHKEKYIGERAPTSLGLYAPQNIAQEKRQKDQFRVNCHKQDEIKLRKDTFPVRKKTVRTLSGVGSGLTYCCV